MTSIIQLKSSSPQNLMTSIIQLQSRVLRVRFLLLLLFLLFLVLLSCCVRLCFSDEAAAVRCRGGGVGGARGGGFKLPCPGWERKRK